MDYAATLLSKLPGASKRDHGLSRLVETLKGYMPDEHVEQVLRAYQFGATAHEGQTRKSGEPYISHPVAVAQELADMRLDSQAISAAILHDAINAMLSKESRVWEINEFGYGVSTKEAFDAVDGGLLAELGLSKNPDDILNAGIFQSEIQGEGALQEMFDEVKAGL